MYNIKNQIYLDMSKNQKSALCNFLRAFVKKNPQLSIQELIDKFFDNEKYYIKINNSRFEFLKDIIDDEKFLNDTEIFIEYCKKYYDYKISQAPIIKAQKDYEKKKRDFLKEIKMSKEFPTKKQISYYKSLCKKYNLNSRDLTSKLDARDEIDRIINEHKRTIENFTKCED